MVIARGFWDASEEKSGEPLWTKGLQLRTLGWRDKLENHLP